MGFQPLICFSHTGSEFRAGSSWVPFLAPALADCVLGHCLHLLSLRSSWRRGVAEGQEPGQVVAKASGVADVGGVAEAGRGLERRAVPGRGSRGSSGRRWRRCRGHGWPGEGRVQPWAGRSPSREGAPRSQVLPTPPPPLGSRLTPTLSSPALALSAASLAVSLAAFLTVSLAVCPTVCLSVPGRVLSAVDTS